MGKLTAANADKYKLYIKSVQCVEVDIDFVIKHYKKFNERKPRSLREDFCGSFSAAADFVSRSKKNTAIAVDLDAEVLAWGREHVLPKLKGRQKDLTILQENVLNVCEPKVDVILAMNFSYFLFKERAALLEYFKSCRRGLAEGGMLCLDAYGGTESIDVCEEEKKLEGFTYVWEQHSFNPINSEAVNYIHFRFPDGTAMEKAFSYEWRLWTLREVTDLLSEAGFADVDIYWEGWDEKKQEGDGNFRPTTVAENCEGWVCYIIAR